jgi:AAA15 family ATPase/GTPase
LIPQILSNRFVEKNNFGESKIYSLEEYTPRHDKEIRKAYLLGRFGAIPYIGHVQQNQMSLAQ